MSDFSPPNPYYSSSTRHDEPPIESQISGLTKFIFILFIIFGLLGIPGGLFGLIQTVRQASLNSQPSPDEAHDVHAFLRSSGNERGAAVNLSVGKLVSANLQEADAEGPASTETENPSDHSDAAMTDGETTGDEHDAHAHGFNEEEFLRKITQEAYPGATAVQIVLTLLSTLVSILMLLGGIWGLSGRLLGLNIVRWTSAFMIPFKSIETGIGAVVAVNMSEVMLSEMSKNLEESADSAPGLQSFIEIMFYVGLGIGIGFGVMLILFYLFCFLHASSSKVRANFH